MASGLTIRASGLNDLVRDFRKLDRTLAREVQKELRNIARMVADTSKDIAGFKDLRDSGALIRGIRPFYRGSTAGVRNNVTRRGFNYPAVYEYGDRGGEGLRVGPRAFLEPALEQDQDRVVEELDELLGRLGRANGFY